MLRDLIQAYPELAAVLVLVTGVVLGKLAEILARRVMSLGDRFASRYGSREHQLVSPLFQQVFSLIVFATVLVLAAIAAVRVLDIPQLSTWLDGVLAYGPRFILGLFIIGLGTVVGALLRNLTAGVLADGDSNAVLPRLVHVGVIAVAVITGLQQLGIDISFITQLALIVLAALLGGLSLAFGIGARQYVANLMAQAELARYSNGERLRIDEDEGEVVEIYRTGLTLSTTEGLVSIPAARLAKGRVIRLSRQTGAD